MQNQYGNFERLVRFKDAAGNEHYGNVDVGSDLESAIGNSVETVIGDFHNGFTRTGRHETIRELLCPVPKDNMVICIGVNYRHHTNEAKLDIPKYPVTFSKPPDTLAAPYGDIYIHPDAQTHLDYEGELTIVIGKEAKNVSADRALEYVLGFTVGNDLSARNFQERGGQFCYAKSFDKFAPIGPCITSTAVISDPHALNLVTKVNGKLRQQTSTEDTIWSIAQIIEHLSRGTTLRACTCIMTGTPGGVAFFMSSQKFLKNGDIVEVEIDKIGKISNKIVFE